jgi:Uma2 family endonuclease
MIQATLKKRTSQINGRLARGQTVVLDDRAIHIPAEVVDLASFRRWADSDEFPEKTHICFLAGEIWVDMSKEQIFTHNQVKGEISRVLSTLVKQERLGRFFSDGVFLTNKEADLSCKPDGLFVTRDCLEQGRLKLVEGANEGFVELEGTPDMVLEVVSASSVEKDTETLLELYYRAGIPEYWLVDAREELDFQIHRRSARGYTAVRNVKGWIKSSVFNRAFRLMRQDDDLGNPEFSLLLR